jgi:sirohydrochlorin ferrochelatase
MSKRMSKGVRKPRPVDLTSYRTDNTIVVPYDLFNAYLAAAQERREEDERKWQSLMDLYSNKCRNGGSYQ